MIISNRRRHILKVMFPVSALWKKSVDTYFDVNGVGICTPLQLLLASVQLVYIPQIAPG